jgi:hypothetical protein
MEPAVTTDHFAPRTALWRAGLGFVASLGLMLGLLVAFNAVGDGSRAPSPALRGPMSAP